MNPPTRRWLDEADALYLHDVLVVRHGGAAGLRDPAGLASALHRPRHGYHADLVTEAAALLESLAINHPFVDGNKRVAFAAADCFLRLNGAALQGDSAALYDGWMALFAAGQVNLDQLTPWLRAHLVG